MAPSLGILLAETSQLDAALARLERPEETQLFLMDDGVRAAGDARLRALSDQGAELVMCAMDAETHGIGPSEIVRAGSQYDHAAMMRDAARVISFTGARVEDHRQLRAGVRHILVRLTRDAHHPKTAQALRTAVGYAALDLQVTVLIGPAARALLEHNDHSDALLRAIGTLRGLGHSLEPMSESVPCADIEVTW